MLRVSYRLDWTGSVDKTFSYHQDCLQGHGFNSCFNCICCLLSQAICASAMTFSIHTHFLWETLSLANYAINCNSAEEGRSQEKPSPATSVAISNTGVCCNLIINRLWLKVTLFICEISLSHHIDYLFMLWLADRSVECCRAHRPRIPPPPLPLHPPTALTAAAWPWKPTGGKCRALRRRRRVKMKMKKRRRGRVWMVSPVYNRVRLFLAVLPPPALPHLQRWSWRRRGWQRQGCPPWWGAHQRRRLRPLPKHCCPRWHVNKPPQ